MRYLRRVIKARFKPYLLLAPAILLALVFTYAPFIKAIASSFFNVRLDGSLGSFAGLGNYAGLMDNQIFMQSLWNTFRFMVFFVPLNLVLILLAVVLTERQTKLNSVYQTMFMLPMAMGMSSMALVFKYMFRPGIGIVNRLTGVDVQWTNDAGAAMTSVVILGIFLDFGLDYLLLLAAMRNLDKAPIEAARLDGAGEWKVLTRIKLPLASPTIFFILFISIKDALLISAPIMVMTEGGPFRSTQTLVYYYYIEAFRNSNHGTASAVAVLTFLIAAIITGLSMIVDKRSVHYADK